MPEIPEIETYRRQMELSLQDKVIKAVTVNRPNALNVSSDTFKAAVINSRFYRVNRRAKILILQLTNEQSILVHYMLEGYAVLHGKTSDIGSPSIALHLESGETLAFYKMNLGYIHLKKTAELEKAQELVSLGPEPLDPEFSLTSFIELLSCRKGMIKPLLMEQKFIAGIGNVYSNEILFCSGILPTRKTSRINDDEKIRLYSCLRYILAEAIEYGGVYEHPYSSLDELSGGYTAHLKVAYRTGEPCYTCSRLIKTKRVGGRNAFYCEFCQT